MTASQMLQSDASSICWVSCYIMVDDQPTWHLLTMDTVYDLVICAARNVLPCTVCDLLPRCWHFHVCALGGGAHSEETATMTVTPVSVSIAATSDSAGALSSELSLKKLACVFSWNSR